MNGVPTARPKTPLTGLWPRIRRGPLGVGILAVLLIGGSAFSQALDIRIRDLVIIPSQRNIPLTAPAGSKPSSKAGRTQGAVREIRGLRIIAGGLVRPGTTPTQAGPRTTSGQGLPALTMKEGLFDPARFDRWDRKQKQPVEEVTTRETLILVAGLAFQYDSNLYRNPTEDNPAASGVSNVDDGSVIGWAGAEYRIGLDEGLDSGIHLDLRTQRYFQETGASTASLSVGAYLHDRWSWGGLFLPYTYTYWWDGSGLDARASVHSVRPMLYWLALENYRIETTAVYERLEYFDQTHDAHRVGLEIGHRYDFARPGTYLRLVKRLSNDFAGDDGYLLAGVSLGGGISIWQGLHLEGTVGYARYWFEDRPGAQIGQAGEGDFARRDNQFQANARFLYQFAPDWEVGLDYTLTLSDSNVEGENGYDPYNFHKHVLTLTASGRF